MGGQYVSCKEADLFLARFQQNTIVLIFQLLDCPDSLGMAIQTRTPPRSQKPVSGRGQLSLGFGHPNKFEYREWLVVRLQTAEHWAPECYSDLLESLLSRESWLWLGAGAGWYVSDLLWAGDKCALCVLSVVFIRTVYKYPSSTSLKTYGRITCLQPTEESLGLQRDQDSQS